MRKAEFYRESKLTESIYKDLADANLDSELEGILLKILQYNKSAEVTEPIRGFFKEYKEIHENYWSSFLKNSSFDAAFDNYYQYSKNKCALIENLLDTLNISLNFDSVREDANMMLKESLTF